MKSESKTSKVILDGELVLEFEGNQMTDEQISKVTEKFPEDKQEGVEKMLRQITSTENMGAVELKIKTGKPEQQEVCTICNGTGQYYGGALIGGVNCPDCN